MFVKRTEMITLYIKQQSMHVIMLERELYRLKYDEINIPGGDNIYSPEYDW